MKRLWALLLSLSALGLHAASSPTVPTISDFFSLPNIRQPRLSPDGTKIAFLFPNENKMALGVFDRETKESRMVIRGEDESIYSFFWKGNDRLVFEADIGGNESFFIGSTDLSGRNVLRLAESQRREFSLVGTAAGIVDSLRFDPDHVGVLGFFAGSVDNALFVNIPVTVERINVRNEARSPLIELKEENRGFSYWFDNSGAFRLYSHLVGRDIVWEARPDDSHNFHEIARHPFHGYAELWEPHQFAADNVTLWMISREEYDQGALYAFNTRTLQRGPALFVPTEGEIVEIVTSYDRSKLLGVAYETEKRHYHWFDSARGELQASLENTFKGCDVRISDTSADENVKLVYVTYDREPGVYFVLDQKAGTLTQFKRVRDIDPRQLRPMQPISYKAHDGLLIHGYLTLPAGAAGKRVPLVVHPHGGPFGIRDYWGYDSEVQFLASRGYAVLQPNYRGSGGYGRMFLDKGKCQWGRAMQDDLTDAVKWAIDQGIADPKRIAIYGASYGGYATLAGVTLTPDLFCCGVNYVGPADLEITFKNRGDDAFLRGNDFSYQREWVGPTSEYRAETSPVNLVDRIKVPTFHAYGEKDPRVKYDHWTRLEAQLKKYNKPYESLEEAHQGHGFRNESAAIRLHTAIEAFLSKYLNGSPAH